MKLFEFCNSETDWVAADDEQSARRCLQLHYGLSDREMTEYSEVSEVDPTSVEFCTDEFDEETEETVTTTAAEIMAGKSRPFVLGSTHE